MPKKCLFLLLIFFSAHTCYANYTPDRFIHCKLTVSSAFQCAPIDYDYVVEDKTDAHLRTDRAKTVYFVQANAEITGDGTAAIVHYYYKDIRFKHLSLRTRDDQIFPDLRSTHWRAHHNLYICTDSTEGCPVIRHN